jgi:hypothetical protein
MTDHPSDPIDADIAKRLVGIPCPECGAPLELGESYMTLGDTKYFSPCLFHDTNGKDPENAQHRWKVEIEPLNGRWQRDGSPRF